MSKKPTTTLHRIEAFLAAAKYLDWDKASQHVAEQANVRAADRRAYQLTREFASDLFGSSEPTLLERVPASERGPGGHALRLTELGEEVRKRALAVESAVTDLLRFNAGAGCVRIACFPAHIRTMVAEVLSRSQYPVRIEEADDVDRADGGARLLAGLRSGYYDVVMAPTGEHPGVTSEIVSSWRMEVVFPRDHPQAQGGVVSPSDLREEDLLLSPDGHASRALVESAFAESIVPLNAVYAGRSTEGLLSLVETGLGIAILPSDSIWSGEWSTRPFVSSDFGGTHSIYWKSGRENSDEVTSVIKIFRSIRDRKAST